MIAALPTHADLICFGGRYRPRPDGRRGAVGTGKGEEICSALKSRDVTTAVRARASAESSQLERARATSRCWWAVGCGKSTLLKIIAGLERQSSGADRDRAAAQADARRAKDRDIAMGSSSYRAISVDLSVRQNITSAWNAATCARERDEAVTRVEKLMQIEGRARPQALRNCRRPGASASPWAATLVRKPLLFLFDEPLSKPRRASSAPRWRMEIKQLHQRLGATRSTYPRPIEA